MPSDGYGEFGSGTDEHIPTLAEVIESWELPAEAPTAGQLRANLLAIVGAHDIDPALIADLAVGPLVMAVGKLEAALAAAERRIAALEQQRNPPDEL